MFPTSDLKNTLGYICKKKSGYLSELRAEIGVDCLERFISVGFVTTGHTLKYETWNKTILADEYYRDAFGLFSYILNQFGFKKK